MIMCSSSTPKLGVIRTLDKKRSLHITKEVFIATDRVCILCAPESFPGNIKGDHHACWNIVEKSSFRSCYRRSRLLASDRRPRCRTGPGTEQQLHRCAEPRRGALASGGQW